MSEEEKRNLVTKEDKDAESDTSDAESVEDDEPTEDDVKPLPTQRSSPWRRLALITFLLLSLWLVWAVRKHANRPKIIYAERYSAEYKYRPAASPILTEILKDGRTRLRGAVPTNK
ncbi:uncharacterized protein B0H18DRAFT_995140 [Fomitopsis serialis]|uniref:uncharacterized protein n=1 Tax=Fomitopsis serialis TaxID=139415 RepID=UPI002008A4F4|nr:uncharacterized protein B0H18DRAFT_995140 [Neoantrodia serialis]KAH9930079.1 hypothetical protein B0H18DRAFT_995140 [Neoantrodia serialis]